MELLTLDGLSLNLANQVGSSIQITVINMLRDAREVIQEHLAPKEKLAWAGKPKTGIAFRTSDILLIPFSIIWCGFALFWEATAIGITSGTIFKNGNSESMSFLSLIFPLWGIPFVLFGLYFVFGRFWVDAKRRERCYYGVTDERIIILSGLFHCTTKSISIKNITDLSLDEKANGTGSITFGPSSPFASWFSGWNWPGTGFNSTPSLELINDAKQVYGIIRDIQSHPN